MTVTHSLTKALVLALGLGVSRHAMAQAAAPSVQLVVGAERPLRVALDRRIHVKRQGQRVTATLVDPLYAYDRVVVPPGTKALGHIEQMVPVSGKTRVRAMTSGDFTPLHRVWLQFDSLLLDDGRTIDIRTSMAEGTGHVRLRVAGASKVEGVAAHARERIAREAKQTVATVRALGRRERVADMLIRSLPYHPELLSRGTLYSVKLQIPLDFGSVAPVERAPAGMAAAPESILNARLVTSMDSGTTPSGTPIEAVLTQPVFSADHRLILPEGARLTGEVTFTRRARRLHRNGQLRFLFQSAQAWDQTREKMLASLYSVESGQGNLVVDEEGGAAITNAKSRLIPPALAAVSLVGTMHGRLDTDTDGAGPETAYGGAGSSTVGGLVGFGVMGAVLSQLSRPVTVAIGAVGLARTTYSSVFGMGREVSFPADTPIQVQLAPGPSPREQ